MASSGFSPEFIEAAHKGQATETRKRQILHDLCLLSVGIVSKPGKAQSAFDVAWQASSLYTELAKRAEEEACK